MELGMFNSRRIQTNILVDTGKGKKSSRTSVYRYSSSYPHPQRFLWICMIHVRQISTDFQEGIFSPFCESMPETLLHKTTCSNLPSAHPLVITYSQKCIDASSSTEGGEEADVPQSETKELWEKRRPALTDSGIGTSSCVPEGARIASRVSPRGRNEIEREVWLYMNEDFFFNAMQSSQSEHLNSAWLACMW